MRRWITEYRLWRIEQCVMQMQRDYLAARYYATEALRDKQTLNARERFALKATISLMAQRVARAKSEYRALLHSLPR